MDYLVVSTAVTDDLTLKDGTYIGKRLGGAGIYALSGIKLWTDSVLLITGVGKDFKLQYGDWFRSNGFSMDGLSVRDNLTAVSEVKYSSSDKRIETPRYGITHYRSLEATAEDISSHCAGVKGIYIFKDLDFVYWNQILELRKRHHFSLLWEINADTANTTQLACVRALAEQCDIFSINYPEACSLFGIDNLNAITEKFLSWHLPMIYLRMGSKGALVLQNEKKWQVPCVGDAKVIDNTGAGNSSSSAVLYGFCEGYSPLECGVIGSISAASCIAQFGPPDFSGDLRIEAGRLKELMMKEIAKREYHAKK